MNMLKRKLAPLTEKAWNEIDDTAEKILKNQLSARKAVTVKGPNGWDFNVITEGKLENIEKSKNGVKSGQYQVKPLTEARITFELNRWELDNIERGAKDIDLDPLEEAVKKIAVFEDSSIFNGLKSANIEGLKSKAANTLDLGNNSSEILDNISRATLLLNKAMTDKPYTLIVSEKAWTKIYSDNQGGYPLSKRIKNLIGGNIILSSVIDGALLIPTGDDDLELTIGKDFAIGYEDSNSEKVKLFISESFTFRVLNEDIIVNFNS